MKTFLATLCTLALAGLTPLQAQLFRPNLTDDAVLGAVAGAIIGNQSHHRVAEGAAIGAATGYVLGSLLAPQPAVVYSQPPTVVYRQPAQVIYNQPAPVTVVPDAPLAPLAPVYTDAPPVQVMQVYQPAPQVVYAYGPPVAVGAWPDYPPGWGYGSIYPGWQLGLGFGWSSGWRGNQVWRAGGHGRGYGHARFRQSGWRR